MTTEQSAVRTRVMAGPGTRAGLRLMAGVAAGPLFIAVAFAQVLLRDGFEPDRHPLSLLSLGDLGWIQVANFVVVGILFVVAAGGLGWALTPGRGAVWAPRLLATFGIASVAGGVFRADPAFGFPAGAPPGAPPQISWHGILHGVAPAIGFTALVVAFFVLASRFSRDGRRGRAVIARTVGATTLVLSVLPNAGGDPEGKFLPLWVAMVLGFGYASAILARLRSEGI